MEIFTRITREALDVQALEKIVADDAAGAVVSFVGLTRDHHLGRQVLGLERGPLAARLPIYRAIAPGCDWRSARRVLRRVPRPVLPDAWPDNS